MKKIVLSLALATLFSASIALAGDCVMHVTRSACPGKDADSYAKCGGKASCDDTKKVGSEAACAKAAEKACENAGDRQKVTKSKAISADFDGKPVEGGKNFCAPDRADFNKCS